MAANPKDLKKIILDEFLDFVRTHEGRYELIDGEILDMSGGTLPQDRLVRNVSQFLRMVADARDCEAPTGNLPIKVPALVGRNDTAPYRYADGAIACDEKVERFGGYDLLVNPILLVEVLSPTTQKKDRSEKFEEYKSIPSLREYLLVSQREPLVTLHSKQPDGTWMEKETSGLDGEIFFQSIDWRLAMRDLYRKVTFPSL